MTDGAGGGSPERRFLAGLIMGLGWLIAGLSGLCTLGVAVMVVISEPLRVSNLLSSLPIMGVFGGIPIALGVGLILLGRRIGRPAPKIDAKTFT